MPVSLNTTTTPANRPQPQAATSGRGRRVEHVSLAICALLALAFAVVMPPFQIPDEDGHFLRAYLISRGEFLGRGTPKLPASVVSAVMRYPEVGESVRKFTPQEIFRDLASRPERTPVDAPPLANQDGNHRWLAWSVVGSSLYFPLVYAPAGLGIWIARTLGGSPLTMMYCARIFNVLTFVTALAISFRLAPSCRVLMTAVALLPMTLQQAGGISADAVTISISFVGLCLVLYSREHLVSRQFLLLLAVVFALWGLCKSSIWAFPLVFLIPSSAFRNRFARLGYVGAVLVCMAGTLLIWNGLTAHNMDAFRAVRLSQGVDIPANLRLVRAHPFAFGRHLVGMVRSNIKWELLQFSGAFGWNRFGLPARLRELWLLLLVLVAATEFSPKAFRGWERGVLLLVAFGGLAVVHAALSVSDTSLCGGTMSNACSAAGIVFQGRYLIPFSVAGLLALRQSRLKVPQVNLLAIAIGAGILYNLASLALIRSTYY